jgi:hypothetical protein
MSEYIAPIRDMQFVLKELAGLDRWRNCLVAKKRPRIWSMRFSKKRALCRGSPVAAQLVR